MSRKRVWTKQKLKDLAKQYDSLPDFRREQNSAYTTACRMGVNEEICKHMSKNPRPQIHTKESCAKLAKQYRTKAEFRREHNSAFVVSHRKGWIDEICEHMVSGHSLR